jgi:hypothetical protein
MSFIRSNLALFKTCLWAEQHVPYFLFQPQISQKGFKYTITKDNLRPYCSNSVYKGNVNVSQSLQ